MADLSGWVQAGVTATVATVGSFFWAGAVNSDVSNQRQRIDYVEIQAKEDHDTVTRLSQQMSDVHEDVAEIKQDVKSLVAHRVR